VTFNSTSTIRIGSCQFAEDAGTKSLTKTWSGENMRKFDLNLVMPRSGDIPPKTPIFGKGFEETLRLCQDVTKSFQGSEDTLRYIQQVEECLRRLVVEQPKLSK